MSRAAINVISALIELKGRIAVMQTEKQRKEWAVVGVHRDSTIPDTVLGHYREFAAAEMFFDRIRTNNKAFTYLRVELRRRDITTITTTEQTWIP